MYFVFGASQSLMTIQDEISYEVKSAQVMEKPWHRCYCRELQVLGGRQRSINPLDYQDFLSCSRDIRKFSDLIERR